MRIWNGPSGSTCGGDTCFMIASYSGVMSPERTSGIEAGVAVQRGGVDDREVELFVGRAEAVEQVERLVQHPVRARAGAIDLVDHDDRLEAHLERLLGHEARLRHRAVHRIDEDQHRVDHRQHALDLAAEVGVARACRRC